MAKLEILDTFPQFLAFWQAAADGPLDLQIERWATDYMAAWPELLAKQQEDYAGQGEDWRQIARERVFPYLGERLLAMEAAHRNLLELCRPLYALAQERLAFESDACFILYVGIGCGAGWVTTYGDQPAILFGLENIAEGGWSEPPALAGMVAHEIGHLAHFHWRGGQGLPEGDGPWWQLYCEGFAQRCEHLILGEETWHMAGDAGDEPWLSWCQAQVSWLAGEFLRLAGAGESVRPFFGSWHDIRGRKQCGYYLGHEVIRALEAGLSLAQIALLEDWEALCRQALEGLARRDA